METKQRLIKRYPNRKLYDTEKSTYITLEEIGEMVKQGEDLKIIDNKTKEDLTSVVLTQVIFETGKKNKSFLPLQTLKELIQSGEESLQDFIQKTITNPVSSFKAEAGKKAKKIMAFAEKFESRVDNIEFQPFSREADKKRLSEFLEITQKRLDDFQEKVDSRVKDLVKNFKHFNTFYNEITEMKKTLLHLEGRVLELERRSKNNRD